MKAMIFTAMPMFVCLFWSIMLVFELHQDGKNRPRLHLLAFMLTATVLYFGHCAFFNHETTIIPFTDTLYCAANLAVYPLYFLYICSLTTRYEHSRLKHMLLVPAIAGGTAVGLTYLSMSEEETGQFISTYLYHGGYEGMTPLTMRQVFIHDVCKVFFAMLILPVFFYGRSYLQKYERLVHEVYADIEDKTLAPIRYMLIAFAATSIASFTANLIGRHQFGNSIWMLAIPSLLFSSLLFAIGYVGYHQHFSMENIEDDEQQADIIESNTTTINDLRVQIEQIMESEQLYRQPNFKIVDLVQRLNTNRNYVYRAINLDMGLSFNEYVNRMRIEYAAMLIAQNPGKPLSEIAEQSGFSSSTSFYRNFKLYKGMGPKEYQNHHKNV
jgi:AraC-like DNA-binding protein